MPKVNVVVRCTAPPDVDLNMLASAVDTAVSSVVGGQCRVIVNANPARGAFAAGISGSVSATAGVLGGGRGSIENRDIMTSIPAHR